MTLVSSRSDAAHLAEPDETPVRPDPGRDPRSDNLFETILIADDQVAASLPIDGLVIEPNASEADPRLGKGTRRIHANTGDVVGHYVTHATDFAYTNFGVHVGQVDRLTFYAIPKRNLDAFFVDCRADSATLGRRVHIRIATGSHRKLVIPCGVAHSFRGLENVITRNDLTLYASAANPSWNPLNDNQVFDWTAEAILAAPAVEINRIPLPLGVARMFYALQHRALSARRLDHVESSDEALGEEPVRMIPSIAGLPDTSAWSWGVNCFDEVAENSWMIIPGLAGCETSMVELELQAPGERVFFRQSGFSTRLTILGPETGSIIVELLPAGDGAPAAEQIEWPCDPRYYLFVPDGVAFRFVGEGRYLLREEREPVPESEAG